MYTGKNERHVVFHVPHDGWMFPQELVSSVCVSADEFMDCHRMMRDLEVSAMVPEAYRDGQRIGNSFLRRGFQRFRHRLKFTADRLPAQVKQFRPGEQRHGHDRKQGNGEILPKIEFKALLFGHDVASSGFCVTGSVKRMVVPEPSCGGSESVPWWRCTISHAMDSPSPVPPDSRERALSTR